MKSSVLSLSFFALTLALAQSSQADFGEIDILVRESVEKHLQEDQITADFSRFSYVGKPAMVGNKMLIQSTVWASELNNETSNVSSYSCTTQILIQGRGQYGELGSECVLTVE